MRDPVTRSLPGRATARRRLWRLGPEHARDVLDEVFDVVLGERLGRRRHRAIQLPPGLGLESAELVQEVLGVLARQPRGILLAAIGRTVAGSAVVALGRLPAGGDLPRVAG